MSNIDLQPLVDLIERLRSPDGCPWDRQQALSDVRAYLLEEAHEVAAAIDTGDLNELAGELGDLFFQTVFTAMLVGEGGGEDLPEILERIHTKMVERHPHVFGDESLETPEEVNQAWESRKTRQSELGASVLDGVPSTLPSLLTAYRMTQKAAGVGFDWEDAAGVLAKIEEEIGELREAIDQAQDAAAVTEEIGDLLFAVANLSRHLGRDPEGALALTNQKSRRRFGFIEEQLAADDRRPVDSDLDEMEDLWERAKKLEP